MPDYRIFETDEFRARLDGLQKRDAAFIRRKLKEYVYPQLKEEPYVGRNVKKLRGYEPDTWRYRIGEFRLFLRRKSGPGGDLHAHGGSPS